jgi:hypothetical protein
MEEDEVAGRSDNVVLVPQRVGQTLDNVEKPFAAGRNMRAVLDVVRRPEALRCSIVTLIEERIERIQNNLYVSLFGGRSHGRTPLPKLILLISKDVYPLFRPALRPYMPVNDPSVRQSIRRLRNSDAQITNGYFVRAVFSASIRGLLRILLGYAPNIRTK